MILRTIAILILVISGANTAAAEPFHHSSGEWREYNHDWLAACPDAINEDAPDYYGFSCFASAAGPENNAANLPVYKLTIIHNRLTGDRDLAITVAADTSEADTSRPLGLSFGNGPVQRFDFSTDLETRYNTINQFFVVDPAKAAALIETMKERNAIWLHVPMTGMRNDKVVRVSLRGVMASLDFMETYARRVAQY